jgi:hypothetical protein
LYKSSKVERSNLLPWCLYASSWPYIILISSYMPNICEWLLGVALPWRIVGQPQGLSTPSSLSFFSFHSPFPKSKSSLVQVS